ncbi:MAG: N-acyl-D-amino-acid deacylase family protein [Gemmatimonadales bacterium]
MSTSRREFIWMGASALVGSSAARRLGGSALAYDLVLRGGTVFDGSGAPGRELDVAVQAGRIVAVARRLSGAGEVLDVRGLAVAPGFIDIHSHADGNILVDPRAESVIRQGVTTVVIGQDGGSRVPNRSGETRVEELFRRFEALPSALNIATMVGAGTVRRIVVGEADRPATAEELARMVRLVEAALASGACGVSSGLEYAPGAFASQAELIALCRPLARRRLPYSTHLRNEDDRLVEAVDEAIAIARGAGCPLHLAHLKTGGERNWPKIDPVFEHLAEARRRRLAVTFDRYPYVAWATGMTNLFPVWALDGGSEALLRRLADSSVAPRIRTDALAKVELVGGWDKVLISEVSEPGDSNVVGRRLDEWARMQDRDPYDAAVGLVVRNRARVGNVVFAMSEANLERFLAHPLSMICSDGGSFATEGPARSGHPHPRGLGTFPRVLGRYVRERKVLTLEQAVHKMTGMPARLLRLRDRGRIAPAAAADLVVFDPATVADRATFEDPFQYPWGIPHVIVNGVVALRDGERTGAGNGRGLRPG